jgi:hypothetical protein
MTLSFVDDSPLDFMPSNVLGGDGDATTDFIPINTLGGDGDAIVDFIPANALAAVLESEIEYTTTAIYEPEVASPLQLQGLASSNRIAFLTPSTALQFSADTSQSFVDRLAIAESFFSLSGQASSYRIITQYPNSDIEYTGKLFFVRVKTPVVRKVRYYNILNVTTFPIPIGIIREGSKSNIVLQPGERTLRPETDLDLGQIKTYVERKFIKLIADGTALTTATPPPVVVPDVTYTLTNIGSSHLELTVKRDGSARNISLRIGATATFPKDELNLGQVANYKARGLIEVRITEL